MGDQAVSWDQEHQMMLASLCWHNGELKVLRLRPTHILCSFRASLRLLHAVSRFYYMSIERKLRTLLLSASLPTLFLIPSLWYAFAQMDQICSDQFTMWDELPLSQLRLQNIASHSLHRHYWICRIWQMQLLRRNKIMTVHSQSLHYSIYVLMAINLHYGCI